MEDTGVKNYSCLSDGSLYSMFQHDSWKALNESDRLGLLSEAVNRENLRCGADYSVNVSFEDMKSNIAGYQLGDSIYLNKEMYVNDRLTESYGDKTIEMELPDSNWQALETALHENRHIYQDKAVAGEVLCDEETKAVFEANGFTVSEIGGERASQYMLGESSYALYYLNPTELDAHKVSQDRTQEIISSLTEKGMIDASAEKYISGLETGGYKAKLEAFRQEFNNENVEKEVSQVLQNTYYKADVPVDKVVEDAVRREMIRTQEVIDNENSVKENSMADKIYEKNGFTYTVSESRTIVADGDVPAQGIKCGSRVTPDGMQPGDQRGHVIAAQEGGPNKSYNMTAQDGKLNQGGYKTIENAEVQLARDGHQVHTTKTAFASVQEGGRPDAYMTTTTVDNTHNIHISQQNMSPEEQAEYNQIANELNFDGGAQNPNPVRENMPVNEYNSLLTEAEAGLGSIKDEFDLNNTTEVHFDEGLTENAEDNLDTSANIADDGGISSEASEGEGISCSDDGGMGM